MIDQAETLIKEPLAQALMNAGCTVKGNNATCPWHDDKTPSAQLKAPNGHWRVTCFKCQKFGDVFDIRAHNSGRPLTEEFPKVDMPPPRPKQSIPEAKLFVLPNKLAVKVYCESKGLIFKWYVYIRKESPVLIVARITLATGKKTFLQFSPMADGKYAAKNLNEMGTLPLYRQDECAAHSRILVVEGEKACDAAWDLGIPATTSAMGAGNAGWSDWSPMAGKQIVIWPDNDENGSKYATAVAETLGVLGCSVQRIDPTAIGLPEGGDIADMVELWGRCTEQEQQLVLTLMNDAERIGASAALDDWHRAVYEGKWRNLEWPLESLGRLSRATMPGSMTLLCADPGAGKSWLMLQLMRHWNANGFRSVVRMFEDDAKSHMCRLLAQMTKNGKHTDDKWISENRQLVEIDKAAFRQELDLLGARIFPETSEIWTHTDLAEWAERHARSGSRVLMIDPITAVKAGKEPWLQDFELAMRLKEIAYRFECSIILTTHPRGTSREPSLGGMAGGVAWARFSHTVLWLEMHAEPEEVTLTDGHVTAVNRTVRILKCRHGKGSGAYVGMHFGNDVQFTEAGIISRAKNPPLRTPPPLQSNHKPPAPSDRDRWADENAAKLIE